MDIRFWAATDTGRTRDHNEDNFLVDKKLKLFIVADGMGGHAAGEVASSVAVREVRRVIADARDLVEGYEDEDGEISRSQILGLLERAISTACARVFHMAQENPDQRGMGTTLSLLMVAGDRGFIGHVGDSRIYMTRAGTVHQLTEDHSLVNELIKRGRLKPGDAFDSPYKNAVTRAVGVYESVEVDTFDLDVLAGDNFLLCSDGLSCYIDDEITRSYLESPQIKEIPERFIKLANECGGKDNITAIVVRSLAAPQEDQSRRMDEVRLKLDTLRGIPLLKYLSYKGLVKVLNITDTRHYGRGEVIFEEGSRGDAFFVILEGRVRLSKGGMALAEVDAGAHFGEMAMVDKSARSATAMALADVRILVIERQQFYELMRQDPVLSVKLMWSFIQVLNTRLRMTNHELISARETVDLLRRTQVGGVVAEIPPLEPSVAGFTSMPITVTDELTPGFLFAHSADVGTDPHILAGQLPLPGDLDDRPGLEPAPADPASGPSKVLADLMAEAEAPVAVEDLKSTAAPTEPDPKLS